MRAVIVKLVLTVVRKVSHSSSKDKDTKPTIPHIKITVTDNDSKAK
jgi:hypothetical protein